MTILEKVTLAAKSRQIIQKAFAIIQEGKAWWLRLVAAEVKESG